MIDLNNVVTIAEACEMLGLKATSTIREQIANGKLDGYYRKTKQGVYLISIDWINKRMNRESIFI